VDGYGLSPPASSRAPSLCVCKETKRPTQHHPTTFLLAHQTHTTQHRILSIHHRREQFSILKMCSLAKRRSERGEASEREKRRSTSFFHSTNLAPMWQKMNMEQMRKRTATCVLCEVSRVKANQQKKKKQKGSERVGTNSEQANATRNMGSQRRIPLRSLHCV
jgi:hypothetical protein